MMTTSLSFEHFAFLCIDMYLHIYYRDIHSHTTRRYSYFYLDLLSRLYAVRCIAVPSTSTALAVSRADDLLWSDDDVHLPVVALHRDFVTL